MAPTEPKMSEQLAILAKLLSQIEQQATKLEEEISQDANADPSDKKNALITLGNLKTMSQEINKLNNLVDSAMKMSAWTLGLNLMKLKSEANAIVEALNLLLNQSRPDVSGKYSALAANLYKDNLEKNAPAFISLMNRLATLPGVPASIAELSVVINETASSDNLSVLSKEITQFTTVTDDTPVTNITNAVPVFSDLGSTAFVNDAKLVDDDTAFAIEAIEIEERYQVVESDKDLLKIMEIEEKLASLEEQKKLLKAKLELAKTHGDELFEQISQKNTQARAFRALAENLPLSIQEIRNSPSFPTCSDEFKKDIGEYEKQPFYIWESSYIDACFEVESVRIEQRESTNEHDVTKMDEKIQRIEARIEHVDKEIQKFQSKLALIAPKVEQQTIDPEAEKRAALLDLLESEKSRISSDSKLKSTFVSRIRTNVKIERLEAQIEEMKTNKDPSGFEAQLAKAQENLEIKRGLLSSKTGVKALEALKDSWEERGQKNEITEGLRNNMPRF